MPTQLVISIINFRTAQLSLQCVQSVLADIDGLSTQVVVVDNASGDGSADIIADWIDAQPDDTPVQLIRSPRNTGFSGGHNQAMTAVKADYYLLLNSDAVLRPGFTRAILDAAEANPKAGLIAPQIETDDGDIQVSCFRFHGLINEFIRGANIGPIAKLLARHVVALNPPVDPSQIEWASFACILLRANMIDQIGLMDDGYFLYFEDSDYCLRARRAGWPIHHAPQAVAVHFRGGSGPVKALAIQKKRLPEYFYASRARFYHHRYGRAGAVMANLAWIAGRGLNRLRPLVGKAAQPTIEKEPRDIWINAFKPDGPRRAPGE